LPAATTDLPLGKTLYTYSPGLTLDLATDRLSPWCVMWFLQDVRV